MFIRKCLLSIKARRTAPRMMTSREEQQEKAQQFVNGGFVECPTKHKQNGNERVKNKKAAHEIAEALGKKYRIQTEVQTCWILILKRMSR